MVKRAAAVLALCVALAGCGYTTKSLLPEDIKRIHVAPVKNAIDLTREPSGQGDRFPVYRPGIEVELTNAITNRFIFDGNLRISAPDEADAIVETKLLEYRRDALRYTDSDDIEEYRVNVVLQVAVVRNNASRDVLWREDRLVGDTTFFVQGRRAASEDEASARAVEDVARRIVDKTLELW